MTILCFDKRIFLEDACQSSYLFAGCQKKIINNKSVMLFCRKSKNCQIELDKKQYSFSVLQIGIYVNQGRGVLLIDIQQDSLQQFKEIWRLSLQSLRAKIKIKLTQIKISKIGGSTRAVMNKQDTVTFDELYLQGNSIDHLNLIRKYNLFSIHTYLVFTVKMLTEDKIVESLIRINQLESERQHIKYIIPLFFNAVYLFSFKIKIIYNNQSATINPKTIRQVKKRYEEFRLHHKSQLIYLQQIHTYMIQQSNDMIQTYEFNKVSSRKPIFQRSTMAQSYSIDEDTEEDNTIYLSQQSQHYEGQFYNQKVKKNSIIKSFGSGTNISIVPIKPHEIPQFDHPQSNIDKTWQKLQKYYLEHKLDEAYQQLVNINTSLLLSLPNSQLSEEKLLKIKKIEQQYKMMTYYYQFFDEPGYIKDKEEKDVKLFYKIYEQTKQVSVRVEAELDISIENFLCIVSQIDLFEKYIPFAYDTKLLKKISRNEKVGVSRAYIPLLSNRQAFFYAAAYDRLKTHNSIFFYSKTLASDIHFQQKINYEIPKKSDLVELEYKFYILQYKPVSYNRGKIRLSTNIDLKLGFLPLFVINKSCRVFAFDYFKNLMNVNNNFSNSEWEKKMKESPDVYDYFKGRIHQYLSQKGTK